MSGIRACIQDPPQLNAGWETAARKDAGLDTRQIMAIALEIRSDDRFDLIHAMRIVKVGNPAHEATFRAISATGSICWLP